MCGCLIVLKLLILKILLAGLTGLITAAHYDYGYHPSAEEYDNLLRETRRFWTHTFLQDERDQLAQKANEQNSKSLENRANYESRYFVPKFQYKNNEAKKFNDFKENSLKIFTTKPLTNVGSSLEFNFFSDELPQPLKVQPTLNLKNKETQKLAKPVKLDITEINVKPLIKPHIFQTNDNSLQTVKINTTQTSLPIYFTNPATGIVYAITELGKSYENFTKANGTIPIFITKEQYERDIFQLKTKYEEKCKNLRILTTPSSFLQKPLANVIPITSSQFTTGATNSLKPLKKPAPVVIKTELIIKDKKPATTPRPVRKKKNKPKPSKPKRKIIKKQKPPGHKILNTTLRPLFSNQSEGPAIILGTRTSSSKSYKFNEKVPTQLEKPNYEKTFSGLKQQEGTKPTTKIGQKETKQHVIQKRSIEQVFENESKFRVNKKLREQFLRSEDIINSESAEKVQQKNITKVKANFKTNNLNQTQHLTNGTLSRNSKEATNSSIQLLKSPVKCLKKRKRLAKIKRNHSNILRTLPRSNKKALKKNKKLRRKPQGKQDTEYYIFDVEESEEEDDDDDDEGSEEAEEEYDDEEEEEVDYDQQNDILAYDDETLAPQTSEAGLSIEDSNEKPNLQTLTTPEKEYEHNSAMTEAVIKPPILDYDNDKDIDLKTPTPYIKKRIRRRPPQLKIDKDYDYQDDDDEDNSITSHLGSFFRMIFYPIQMIMGNVMDSFSGKDASEEDDHSYTKYTSYHKTLKQQHSDEDYNDDEDEYDSNESTSSSLSNWFSSWFAFNRRNKKIGSTTVAPIKVKPTKTASSWLPSWLTFGANDRISTETASNEDYDEYDKWFASWFGEMKPKARKRTTTTSTSTTTQIPHVPILTIVDPMKNPHNWIGILAHHIINHTSTSTANPLKDIWNKVTTTTTENPEIPRKISYDKYQIWRLKPQDDSQVKALEEYKKSEDGIKLQWLKGPSLRGLTDVLVPPKMLVDFQASLTFELIDHEVLIFDVGKAIAYEKTKEDYFFTTTQKPKKQKGKHPSSIATMTWHKYYEYDDIIKYLETMRMRFPNLVELIHIGRSYEGRPLIVTKIESREAAAVNSLHYTAHRLNKLRHKKRIGLANAVFIEAGTHGMEWIGPATATWIINELLRIMKKNISDDQSFIRNTTWYIMPVLNPDGYVFSHEFDRFWKKSRSRHISRPSGILSSAMTWLQKKRAREKVCFGVDLDRNWHYQWGKRGSSKSACNEFYAGPTPFSEPETKALSEFLMDYRTQIKLFVSMQSYGQIISYPYKANTTYDSERLDDLLDVAMVGTDGLRKKGSKSRYKIDSSNDLVENRSGCSDAFAAYEVGIPFSYTLQLADNGVHGYLLPSASIESTAKDSFDIITGMLDYI